MESLKVNRDFLNPNFNGYKLSSLVPPPTYNINVAGVDSVKLRDDEYTLQHVKAFGITNLLTLDQWYPNNVLYVDNTGSVMRMRVIVETDLSLPQEVFNIPNFRDVKGRHRHNVTISFPCQDLCVLSDGAGTLYVLETGDRGLDDAETWKVVFQGQVCGEAMPFTIQHSMATAREEPDAVHCLALHIDEIEEEEEGEAGSSSRIKSALSYRAMLEWFTITHDADSTEFQLSRTRRFQSKTVPTYSAIDETGQFVYIASPSPFELIYDSQKEVAKKEEEADGQDQIKEKTLYTWTQTEDDITITFILPDSVGRKEIHFKVASDRIELGIHDKVMLLEGALFKALDTALCTWTFNKRKLEVNLAKQEEGPMWTDLVIGDHRGQYVVDPDMARRIHEKLEHLTTDDLNADPKLSGGTAGINSQDLEECDMWSEENTTLVRFDGDNHCITHQVNIGSYQYLFTAQRDPTDPPCLCLRHDVDGLIWQPTHQPDASISPWQHVNTFNALGYVQASKQERKFTSCPPSSSYAVICDCVKRLYIYRQPEEIINVLKNRKSGETIGAIAQQQLVSLDTADEVLGMRATEDRIFVLTSSKLYIIRVGMVSACY